MQRREMAHLVLTTASHTTVYWKLGWKKMLVALVMLVISVAFINQYDKSFMQMIGVAATSSKITSLLLWQPNSNFMQISSWQMDIQLLV